MITSIAAITARIARVLPGFCLPILKAIKLTATSNRKVKVFPNAESEKFAKFCPPR